MAKRPFLQFHRPQQIAAALLLLLLAQCLWVVTDQARTDGSTWQSTAPASLSGAQTSQQAQTSGVRKGSALSRRVRALPLAAAELVFGKSRLAPAALDLLAASGFIFFGLALGAALWWVTRRLYGNTGGCIALALYCFSPPVIHASSHPNAQILAAFGFFASIYTAMGVAHALHGPKHKWRPRIVLFTLSLGVTAAASLPGFLLAVVVSIALLAYLAPDRRAAFAPVLSAAILGALLLGFACSAFQPDTFLASIADGRMLWLTTDGLLAWFALLPNAAVTIAAAAAFLFYCLSRRSRYFGNTLPLLLFAGLVFLATPSASSGTIVWALPFLFVFVAGVFADMLESEARRAFFWAAGSVLAFEITMAAASLIGPPLPTEIHFPNLIPASVSGALPQPAHSRSNSTASTAK